MFRIHLGWLQLKKEKLRSAVALAGVCFAVTLVLVWFGFQAALFESAARYHQRLVYDIVLVSPESSYIVNTEPFSSRRLYQALGLEAVESVSPVYASLATWKNPFTSQTRPIFVLGFDPSDTVFAPEQLGNGIEKIRLPDVVLFDEASRPEFGPIAERYRTGHSVSAEVNNRRIEIQGLFTMGTSFGVDGSLVTSDLNFLRLFPDRREGLIDLGLIRTREGEDAVAVRDRIRARLPRDVLVLTKPAFAKREQDYWDSTTAIGYVFNFGVLIGLVVGSIIVYQILFADVSDHLAEYATLKAMGYSNWSVSLVVVEEAIVLAVLGYLPGLALSIWLYARAAEATQLPLHMTPGRALGVLGLTIAMCCVSSVMALRKIRAADPAEVF